VIIRHIRTRPATTSVRDTTSAIIDDGLRLDGAQNFIGDHLSIENGFDETMQVSRSSNITLQNSILAELIDEEHTWGTGMLINYSSVDHPLQNLSFHHNTWNRQQSRLPEISCEENEDDGTSNCTGRTLNLELSNNLIFDQGMGIWYDAAGTGGSSTGFNLNLNWIGNMAFNRSDYDLPIMNQDIGTTSGNQIFFSDNRYFQFPDLMNYALMGCCNGYPGDGAYSGTPSTAISARHAFPTLSYSDSEELLAYSVRYMGAFTRDPMDRRLLNPVASQTIATTGDFASRMKNPCGDAFNTDDASESAITDSDHDGMPDTWESQNGLNPSSQDSTGTTLGNAQGYTGLTNIEVYLHERHQTIIGVD
jgi:hypothetical protein